MLKQKIKAAIQQDNRRMMMQNMQRQSMASWDSKYYLVSDFTNADQSDKWTEIKESLLAVAGFLFVIVATGVFYGWIV